MNNILLVIVIIFVIIIVCWCFYYNKPTTESFMPAFKTFQQNLTTQRSKRYPDINLEYYDPTTDTNPRILNTDKNLIFNSSNHTPEKLLFSYDAGDVNMSFKPSKNMNEFNIKNKNNATISLKKNGDVNQLYGTIHANNVLLNNNTSSSPTNQIHISKTNTTQEEQGIVLHKDGNNISQFCIDGKCITQNMLDKAQAKCDLLNNSGTGVIHSTQSPLKIQNLHVNNLNSNAETINSAHYVTTGATSWKQNSSGNKPDSCLPNVSTSGEYHNRYGKTLGVQCCSSSTSNLGSRPDCISSTTYEDAEAHCKSHDMVLCSREQINKGAGRSTGCNFDAYQVWTRDMCSAPAETSPEVSVSGSFKTNTLKSNEFQIGSEPTWTIETTSNKLNIQSSNSSKNNVAINFSTYEAPVISNNKVCVNNWWGTRGCVTKPEIDILKGKPFYLKKNSLNTESMLSNTNSGVAGTNSTVTYADKYYKFVSYPSTGIAATQAVIMTPKVP